MANKTFFLVHISKLCITYMESEDKEYLEALHKQMGRPWEHILLDYNPMELADEMTKEYIDALQTPWPWPIPLGIARPVSSFTIQGDYLPGVYSDWHDPYQYKPELLLENF